MATRYEDSRLEPRRRIIVIGKAEKEQRDARRQARSRRSVIDDRDVPTVDELRKSREEYYARAPAERTTAKLRPLDQELKPRASERRPKKKASARHIEARDVPVRKSEKGGSRRHRRRKAVPEDDGYVYRDAPIRARSVKGETVVTEIRRESYHDEPRTKAVDADEAKSQRSRGGVHTPRAPSPPAAQASPEKLSRSSTKVGSGSHRTRSSTVRSRSRSRSRHGGTVRMRTVKVKGRDVQPPMPSVPEDNVPLASPVKEKRRASFFGGFFAGKARMDTTRTVECLTCASEAPSSKAAILECGHVMCHRCLKRVFTLSVTDPQHMPPRCCTSDHIALKHVTKLFDDKFKARWNKKFEEYTTQNRLYCPARGCGAWISPQMIRPSKIDQKRNVGVCRRCDTRVCAKCGRKWHTNEDCDRLEKDADAREFVKMAAASGWQRCYNCTATVELKEGCNHMTCRCGAEFCMRCGDKWKSCDCPWFDAGQLLDEDRLDMPNDLGRQHGYAEEQGRRRAQELYDEDVARRMQGLEIDDWENEPRREYRYRERGGGGDGWTSGGRDHHPVRARSPAMERGWGGNDTAGYGNQAGHFLNDNFVQRATRILTGRFSNENREAADRLVQEIRSDRAPPLPRNAVIDPIRDERDRSRGERSRPGSRRMAGASDILDGAGTPTRGHSTRRQKRDAPPARESERYDTVDHLEDKRRSVLAGMATRHGESRVEQWRQYVQDGEPEGGAM